MGMELPGKVASLGDDYADGTPNLEINFPVKEAVGSALLNPAGASITLKIKGKEYSGFVLANKPKHDIAWISPTIHDESGKRLRLGEVLMDANLSKNEDVRLKVTEILVEVSPAN